MRRRKGGGNEKEKKKKRKKNPKCKQKTPVDCRVAIEREMVEKGGDKRRRQEDGKE